MKKIILICLFFTITGTIRSQGVYAYSVPKIEGGSQSLSGYVGKRLLIITLPVQQDAAADSLLFALDTLAAAHLASLQVIAVPAYEDGFTPALKTGLQTWYRSRLGEAVLITDGLYTSKQSGTQQHTLFNWLTHDGENEVFDIDTELGTKFFTNEEGELYGVLQPHTKISSLAVQKTLVLTVEE